MDIFDFLTMLGGLSLFLFGMSLMGSALERRAGSRLRSLLDQMTGKPLVGFLTVVEQLAKLRLIVLERKLARVERINVAPLAVHIREQQRVALADRDHAAARDCAFCFGRRLLIAAARRGWAGRPRAAREQGAEQRQDEQKGKTSFHGRYLLEWFLFP